MEEDLRTDILDRWDKMIARSDAAFNKIMSKMEILLQQYNCSPISSHGAANSSKDIPTSEPINVNLPIQDEIRSSAKQIESLLVQGDNIDEQSIVVEEGISDFNQHSSSLEGAGLEIEDSIEDSLVQSQFLTENPFNDEHTPLFFEPENQDDDNKFQPYALITEERKCSAIVDTILTVVAEQKEHKELVTIVGRDLDQRVYFDFNFVVPELVYDSVLALATFASTPVVPLSMKTAMNTTSTTPPQHLVPSFDPGGNSTKKESPLTNPFPSQLSKLPDYCFATMLSSPFDSSQIHPSNSTSFPRCTTIGSIKANAIQFQPPNFLEDQCHSSFEKFLRSYGMNHFLHLYGMAWKSFSVQHVCGSTFLIDNCENYGSSNESNLPLADHVTKTIVMWTTNFSQGKLKHGYVLWLAIDMVVSLINAYIAHYYETTLERNVFLAKEWILDKFANTYHIFHHNLASTNCCPVVILPLVSFNATLENRFGTLWTAHVILQPRDYHTTSLQLWKIFREGKISIEEGVFALKVVGFGLLIDAVGSVFNAFVLGICQHYCFHEASNWVYTMIENDTGTTVACYYIFLHFYTVMGNIDLLTVVFSLKLLSKFNHNSHTFTYLIACQFLGARFSSVLGLRIMIHEGFGIKVTTILCVVSILPLVFARIWCSFSSLIQAYIMSNSYTSFTAIEKLLCTNPSSIFVTLDFMVVRFRSGLTRSQLNLVGANTAILIGHSMTWNLDDTGYFVNSKRCLLIQQWDPGGYFLVHYELYLIWRSLENMFLSLKCIVLTSTLRTRLVLKGGGNDMIYFVLVQCLLTNMFYNEKIICEKIIYDITNIEVERWGKTMLKRINRLWCCYKSCNNEFLVYDFIPNASLVDTLNVKQKLLDWHYNCSSSIVIDASEELAYLHQNWILPIVHKYMRSTKEIGEVAKVVIFVSMEYYGYIALMTRRKRTKWDPHGHVKMCATIWSFKFKQWDPGKICVMNNFYNLEDKVVFEGEGIVMSPRNWIVPNKS